MADSDLRATEQAQEHARVWAAIPWCVAGSATPEDLARALAHIEHCADCRAEWALNLRWREALGGGDERTLAAESADAAETAEATAADASLETLWQRIDADAAMSPISAQPLPSPSPTPRPAQRGRWIAVLAAASVLQAVGLVALAALWWQGAGEGRFETLSREPAALPSIQLQLAPDASEAEVLALVQRLRQEPAISAVTVPSPLPLAGGGSGWGSDAAGAKGGGAPPLNPHPNPPPARGGEKQ